MDVLHFIQSLFHNQNALGPNARQFNQQTIQQPSHPGFNVMNLPNVHQFNQQSIPMGQVQGVESAYPQNTGGIQDPGEQSFQNAQMAPSFLQQAGSPQSANIHNGGSNGADPFGWKSMPQVFIPYADPLRAAQTVPPNQHWENPTPTPLTNQFQHMPYLQTLNNAYNNLR